MSQLENAMAVIINIFGQYAAQAPPPDKLSKKEVKQVIEKELSGFLKDQANPTIVEEVFKLLDQNPDQEMHFEEFMAFVTKVTSACHKSLHKE
ncbi:protein S100-B-like [Eublepharis macularius]|uniref:Protein S100-B-like n=1 Tax=Eublepharis macularius TaxID=481883 RepID=A0AA97KI02_EUBMA|nr:protein S100-B-like [Eublepharis macularius]XP_054853171.1 protein S100-B-like [Eublepharis macularius]XP_054855764.1 protein S100-B-like [Eublepharis macularius]